MFLLLILISTLITKNKFYSKTIAVFGRTYAAVCIHSEGRVNYYDELFNALGIELDVRSIGNLHEIDNHLKCNIVYKKNPETRKRRAKILAETVNNTYLQENQEKKKDGLTNLVSTSMTIL